MPNQPLTEHEIALAKAHFKRVASPALVARMEAINPTTGLAVGDDPEVIRAWLQRARSPEGLATALYGTDNTFDEDFEITRSRRLGDALMRARSQPNARQSFKPGDTSKAAILATFYPETRR